MKKHFIFILLFTLIFSQCEDDRLVNPEILIPESNELSKMITHQIVAKDSIHLKSTETAYLAEPYFSHIIFGECDKLGVFSPVDTIVPTYKILPTYKMLDYKYLIQFMYSIRVPKSTVIYDLEARFYFNSKDFRSTLIPIKLYKYPFPSAELFVDLDFIPGLVGITDKTCIQGFDIYRNDLYFRLSGSSGVFLYTLGKNNSELLFPYTAGDWISLFQNYLFIEISHDNIVCLNLDTREVDLDFIKNEDWMIRGIDLKNDTLYVLSSATVDSSIFLTTFDLNGNQISSESFEYNGWSITISEDYLYTWTFEDIVRYHLPSKKSEIIHQNLELNIESIQVVGGRFYYSDVDKRIICYLPLNDFLSI